MRSLMILLLISGMFMVSCNNKKAEEQSTEISLGMKEVKIKQVIQTASYTYLESEKNEWYAVTRADLKEGGTILVMDKDAMLMTNFESKQLGKVFEEIYFLNDYKSTSTGSEMTSTDPHNFGQSAHSGRKIADEHAEIDIEPVEGSTTIEELFANKKAYANKQVKMSGVVVKVNNAIMGRNWIHIQDGTRFNDEFDLTVTTQEKFEVDQKVVLQGKISLDKDFTSGYFYPIILEGARVVE